MLTSQWLLCIHCFTSLVSFTGCYTEDDPKSIFMDENNVKLIILFVEVNKSLRQVKGKLGHVVQIHVCRLLST